MSRKRKADDHNMSNHGKMSAANHMPYTNGDQDFKERPVQTWSAREVARYLDQQGHQPAAKVFSEHNISGKELLSINEDRLSTMGLSSTDLRLKELMPTMAHCLLAVVQKHFLLPLLLLNRNSFNTVSFTCMDPAIADNYLSLNPKCKVGDQLSVLNIIKDIYKIRLPYSFKVFNDSIHGHIELHPLCVKIIDTPEFQRLRFIKQLGACYFVFPGAAHNRFEHSLGVCHLAGQLVRTLRGRQPELNITDQDVLCVEIAGLCHDLGHGPFSHLFDGKFVPELRPGEEYQHEAASVKMFDHLVESNYLLEAFAEYGLSETDIKFIKEQIVGPPYRDSNSTVQEWTYKGRKKEKSFLYEIVANKKNGIDVDKWDYFARDCHMLGIQNNFDHTRFIKFARVLMVDGERQICCRDKEVSNLYDMFHTRITLHRRAYQHRVCRIIENMIVEALIKANDVLKFPGKNGKLLRMSEAIDDMKAYSLLTDDVFGQIQRSTEPELKESREIIKKILRRDLYKFLGQTRIKEDQEPGKVVINKKNIPCIKTSILESRIASSDETEVTLTKDDIIIDLVSMNYGMKTDNPMDHYWFYEKKNPDVPVKVRKDEVSQMLPTKFNDQYLRLYCKKNSPEQLEVLQKKFTAWCEAEKTTIPRGGSFEMTPYKAGSEDASGTPYKVLQQTQLCSSLSDKAKHNLQF